MSKNVGRWTNTLFTFQTLPERYDFFLVSQSVRQGTVNPTSYNVIHDESGWSPGIDYMNLHSGQKLTGPIFIL
jgi:hypothetical protein